MSGLTKILRTNIFDSHSVSVSTVCRLSFTVKNLSHSSRLNALVHVVAADTQLQYSDQASINYYDVIIIIATIVKVLQSSVHKPGVCVQYTECMLSL